ncbi:MAG: cytochrome C oxidase subunit IV family protein [Flavobacteriaceae bacterium]
MAHAQAHESHKGLIWKVFGLLTVITLVEVFLGIKKYDFLHLSSFLGTSLLNWIFLILTLVKAYYIAWYFMHLNDEHKWFRRSIVWTLVFFILYLSFFVLIEGGSIGDSFTGLIRRMTTFH